MYFNSPYYEGLSRVTYHRSNIDATKEEGSNGGSGGSSNSVSYGNNTGVSCSNTDVAWNSYYPPIVSTAASQTAESKLAFVPYCPNTRRESHSRNIYIAFNHMSVFYLHNSNDSNNGSILQ